MNKNMKDLISAFTQHTIEPLPDDLPIALIENVMNRAAIKSLELFILNQFSKLTDKKIDELQKEYDSILTTYLADEFSSFFSKRPSA